jgi:hypothetical protein
MTNGSGAGSGDALALFGGYRRFLTQDVEALVVRTGSEGIPTVCGAWYQVSAVRWTWGGGHRDDSTEGKSGTCPGRVRGWPGGVG